MAGPNPLIRRQVQELRHAWRVHDVDWMEDDVVECRTEVEEKCEDETSTECSKCSCSVQETG